jgi:hypothetical protein
VCTLGRGPAIAVWRPHRHPMTRESHRLDFDALLLIVILPPLTLSLSFILLSPLATRRIGGSSLLSCEPDNGPSQCKTGCCCIRLCLDRLNKSVAQIQVTQASMLTVLNSISDTLRCRKDKTSDPAFKTSKITGLCLACPSTSKWVLSARYGFCVMRAEYVVHGSSTSSRRGLRMGRCCISYRTGERLCRRS